MQTRTSRKTTTPADHTTSEVETQEENLLGEKDEDCYSVEALNLM